MTFGRFRRWFPPDLVVPERDKPLEGCVMIRRRVVGLVRQHDFRAGRGSLCALYGKLHLNRVGRAEKGKRLGDRFTALCLSSENQASFAITSQFQIVTLQRIDHVAIVDRRCRLPANPERERYTGDISDHLKRRGFLIDGATLLLELEHLTS